MSTDDSLDEQDRASEEAAARRLTARTIDAEDLKWIMKHSSGRRFVWRLLEMSTVFHNPWRPSSHEAAFRAGHMNIGQMLLAQLHEHCLDAYIIMMKEHKSAGSKHAGTTRS